MLLQYKFIYWYLYTHNGKVIFVLIWSKLVAVPHLRFRSWTTQNWLSILLLDLRLALMFITACANCRSCKRLLNGRKKWEIWRYGGVDEFWHIRRKPLGHLRGKGKLTYEIKDTKKGSMGCFSSHAFSRPVPLLEDVGRLRRHRPLHSQRLVFFTLLWKVKSNREVLNG